MALNKKGLRNYISRIIFSVNLFFFFFASATFGDGCIQFQDNKVSFKQAPGHDHENTIFQLEQCPF